MIGPRLHRAPRPHGGERRTPRRGFAVWLAAAALAFALALAVPGCSAGGAAGGSDPEGSAETWAVYLYLCGSSLESSHGRATDAIEDILATDLPSNVTVVLQTGGARRWHTDGVASDAIGRYVVEGGSLSRISQEPAASMGVAGTLADFLAFCAGSYPADHAAVVLWGHGDGPAGGMCIDENFGGDSLDLSELASALGAGTEARGEPFDIVGMDACFMATVETAEAAGGSAEYLVASEGAEPGAGWDYRALVESLGGASDAEQAARAICDGYRARCEADGTGSEAALSAVDLKAADALAAEVERFAASVAAAPDGPAKLADALRLAEPISSAAGADDEGSLVDLGEFARCASGAFDAEGVLASLGDAVAYSVAGDDAEKASGLALYWPFSEDAEELSRYLSLTPLPAYGALLAAAVDSAAQL